MPPEDWLYRNWSTWCDIPKEGVLWVTYHLNDCVQIVHFTLCWFIVSNCIFSVLHSPWYLIPAHFSQVMFSQKVLWCSMHTLAMKGQIAMIPQCKSKQLLQHLNFRGLQCLQVANLKKKNTGRNGCGSCHIIQRLSVSVWIYIYIYIYMLYVYTYHVNCFAKSWMV